MHVGEREGERGGPRRIIIVGGGEHEGIISRVESWQRRWSWTWVSEGGGAMGPR